MNIIKSKNYLVILLLCPVFLLFCCKTGQKGEEQFEDENIEGTEYNYDSGEHVKKVKQIFYNVPSPIEMAQLMERTGVDFNLEILNPIDNFEEYTTISEIALNLGVYGADLSYTRIFDQIQETVNYLSIIRILSDALGIPQDQGSFAVSRLEENIENRDSLIQIISDTYSSADLYLKENDRGNTASLIILGGWVEALYLSTNIMDLENPNKEIMNRIAEQKYSLDNLIALLKAYKDDKAVLKFYPDLQKLKKSFDKIKITYIKGDIVTDPVKKVTTISSEGLIDVSIEQIIEIKNIINSIRKKIIE